MYPNLYLFCRDDRVETRAGILTYVDEISEYLLCVQVEVIEPRNCFMIQFDLPVSNFRPDLMKNGPDVDEVSCVK